MISPIVVEQKIKRLDLPVALLAGIGLSVLLFPGGGEIGRGVGGILLTTFAGYLAISLWAARAHRKRTNRDEHAGRPIGPDVFWIAVGLVLVALGASAFVEGAKGAAGQLGVPSEVIALTAVAFGTSVPELVTTIQSARQGHPELAVGNVAGSNVFNLMLVLGISSVAKPIDASAAMGTDVLVMTGFAVLAFPIFGRFVRIPRWQGWMMVTLCAVYWVWVFASGRPVG